jgi:hypothetical protein
MSPVSSGSNSKPSKKPAEAGINGIFKVHNTTAIKSALKAFSTEKEQLIKGRVQYIKDRFAETGNSFSLATSIFDTTSWPSATDGLQKFGKSKIKVIATHFANILIGSGRH